MGALTAMVAVREVWEPVLREIDLHGRLTAVPSLGGLLFGIVPSRVGPRHHYVFINRKDIIEADSLAVLLDRMLEGLVARAWFDEPYGASVTLLRCWPVIR